MIAKKVYESLGDILKPKSRNELEKTFSTYGLTGIISIKIRKPTVDYVQLRFDRCVEYANVKVSPWLGKVPDEEDPSSWIQISGEPWNVYNFMVKFYDFEKEPLEKNIEKLKYALVFSSSELFETKFEDIKETDIINKETLNFYSDNFTLDLFMHDYAYENGLDPDEMDVDEWSISEEGEKWINYEIETRFNDTMDMLSDKVLNDEITIWRKMTVPSNWIKHLEKQGGRLGIYWSWDENSAEEHWGYDSNKDLATIESSINADHVNWIDTIRTNMNPSNEGENEIRLFKNTPIKINRLWINDIEIDISSIKNKIFKA